MAVLLMSRVWSDDWLTVYAGDCREVMAGLPAESVHCVVTSPPYWGLRDYGTATWGGGDPEHAHVGSVMRTAPAGTEKQASNRGAVAVASGDCACGARRIDNQLGLEPTPEEYVANMVAVFREVRRVLRADGTVWLNLGDTYSTAGGAGEQGMGQMGGRRVADHRIPRLRNGLKPKDLVGIPWRVAFALQADGWYLRSDIVWAKLNPMPESVTDRPTKSHEYIFLLSKSARYYYDADAVRESNVREWDPANNGAYTHQSGEFDGKILGRATMPHSGLATAHPNPAGRNLRSVWTIATQPYPGAHFATFPRKLVEPCIKAGCPQLGTVLDPFAGSGTTGLVAQSLGRRAILIDLSTDYMAQIMARNAQMPLPA